MPKNIGQKSRKGQAVFHRNVLLLEYHIKKNCGLFCLISIYMSSVNRDIMKNCHLAKNGKKESVLNEFQKKEGLETKNMIPPKISPVQTYTGTAQAERTSAEHACKSYRFLQFLWSQNSFFTLYLPS